MRYILFTLMAIAMMVSCSHKHDHDHDHHDGHVHGENCDHDHEEVHNHAPDAIIFTPEQAAKIDFETAKPQVGPFGQIIRTTAQVQSSSTDMTLVSAQAAGTVVFDKNLSEGQSVRTENVLFRIAASGVDNNTRIRLAEAKSAYEKAEKRLKPAETAAEIGLMSQKDFAEVQSDYEIAKTTWENLQTVFAGDGQKVKAGKNGFITQLLVKNGEYVEDGTPLAILSTNRSLVLRADVAPKFASVLPFIIDAVIKTSDKKTYTLADLNGRVLSFGRSLDPDNYFLPVTFEVDNRADFLPGSFVEIFIKTRSDESAMTLPNTALTEEQGLFFVYVQLCPESYEKREVTLGATDGIRTQILSGLRVEEKVVTLGAMSVKLAQSSGSLDPHAGHVH